MISSANNCKNFRLNGNPGLWSMVMSQMKPTLLNVLLENNYITDISRCLGLFQEANEKETIKILSSRCNYPEINLKRIYD